MKVTDFSKIANKYDQNSYRLKEVKWDQDLKDYIDQKPKTKYDVLDLACGTGIYLQHQMKYFHPINIDWYGLDASEDMLNIAKQKLNNVSFVLGLAENMPYESEKFDYIANNYAFHHFINKEQVLDEVFRVLKKGGIFKLHNIIIHDMKKWWVYHYFPSAYYEDLKRFWDKEVIFHELLQRGFHVELKIKYKLTQIPLLDYLNHAENRDISVLTLINDDEYQEGLEKMLNDVKKNPDKTIVNEFAELFCLATKRES